MFVEDNRRKGLSDESMLIFSIAPGEAEVLPHVDQETLCGLLRRLPPDEVEMALRCRLVPVLSIKHVVLYAACGPVAFAEARRRGLRIVAQADTQDLTAAIRAVYGRYLLDQATYGLARCMPSFSAQRRLTGMQAAVFLLLAACLIAGGLIMSFHSFWIIASSISGLFFLGVVALRVLCFLPPLAQARERMPPPIPPSDLPVYSVLVPLFRETAVLNQLIGALSNLRYPPEKLDIKLILEEEDMLMQQAVAALTLPDFFEVIVVPAGRPQTKPRALSYALSFCRGELLTIYDAEDIPEPSQLLKAAARFARSPPDLACLQAQLTFFNPEDNWMTRQFTAEYALLFGVLLPVLADHGLPLPLGGTSNHFRIAVLRGVGGWDPFNVTEDADLGLRLARHGYRTATLDSFTFEEANNRLGNWMRQRVRWMKGFLATWLVHTRHPATAISELGPAGFWTAQVLTIGVFASVLLHPLCMALTIALFIVQPGLTADAGAVAVFLAGLNLFVLTVGYTAAILLTRRGLRLYGINGWNGTLATMPFYWVLMSAAAWMAIWQFITKPFHWNKTVHGLAHPVRNSRTSGRSRLSRPAQRAGLRRGTG